MDLLLIPLYGVSGALLSEIDNLEDRNLKHSEMEPIILAIINSLLMAYLIVTDFGSAIIFTAILLGVWLGGKIDNLPFLLGSLVLGGAIMYRFLYLDFMAVILLPIALAINGYLDEFGHDRVGKIRSRLMQWFFQNRFTMKFGVFVIAYFGLISIWHFLGFLIFDGAYELNARRYR